MKTNNILIVALGFILLMNTSCGLSDESDRCEGDDIFLGKLDFEEETNLLFPNPLTTRSIVFKSEMGNTINLNEQTESKGDYQLKVEAICGEMDAIFSSNIYSYYEGNSQTIVYDDQNDNTISINKSIRIATDFLPEEFLYDRFTVAGRFNETYFGPINLIISVRGKEDRFPQNYLEETTSYQFDESLELGGVIYENVYSSLKTYDYINGTIYLTKEDGVIGLLDKDDVYWSLVQE